MFRETPVGMQNAPLFLLLFSRVFYPASAMSLHFIIDGANASLDLSSLNTSFVRGNLSLVRVEDTRLYTVLTGYVSKEDNISWFGIFVLVVAGIGVVGGVMAGAVIASRYLNESREGGYQPVPAPAPAPAIPVDIVRALV